MRAEDSILILLGKFGRRREDSNPEKEIQAQLDLELANKISTFKEFLGL